MKTTIILFFSILILGSCGQGTDRADDANGRNGKNYTDAATTDSTRVVQDSLYNSDSASKKRDSARK
ncbi:MAG: hypothetical protein JWN76_229 [Chitinophagaceae bacterium]|nr:hypothetical protein [Chitinophagaceae bacterium]